MKDWKLEALPALVAVVAVVGVVLLALRGKIDGTAALAIVGVVLTQAGLKPAVAKLPPQERDTDPQGLS